MTIKLCLVCDDWYSSMNATEVNKHMHPEPQSGLFRDAFLKSGLPYDRWIIETREGQNWRNRRLK